MTTQWGTQFEFDDAGRSDVGRVRKINEDSMLLDPHCGLWAVADGMGGHAAGDFASRTVVDCLDTLGVASTYEDLRHRMADRLNQAHHRVNLHAAELGRGSIGSTLIALATIENRFLCYWSGDSRMYLLRDNKLVQVSRDHTEVQVLLDSGQITEEQAETWPRKNVITRAIGVTPSLEVEMVEGLLQDGDLFLLCSDGLSEYFGTEELEHLLAATDWSLEEISNYLVAQAVERGGKDNVSVVLVRSKDIGLRAFEVDGQFPEFEGML